MYPKFQKKISSGADYAELDFVLASGGTPLIASFYDRSLQTMKAIGASFNAKRVQIQLVGDSRTNGLYANDGAYDFYCTKVDGYDPFYHGIVISRILHEKYLVTTAGQEADDFYSFLMRNHSLPLLKEWAQGLWNWAENTVCRRENGELYLNKVHNNCRTIQLPNGREVALEDVEVYYLGGLTPENLEKGVTGLLQAGVIRLTKKPQDRLQFESMDDYFNRYGGKIVKNLSEQLQPLAEYTGEVDNFTLKHKRLYPQQIAMVRGITALLTGVGNKKERRKNHSRYGLLVEGMGTGKTIQGASICEAVAVATALRGGKSLNATYSTDKDDVTYRNIVMCPGHLVEKWAAEIEEEVPYAKATVLRDFSELLELWKKGPERSGKEFYVMSKDFAKLSYSEKPVPTKVAARKIRYRRCDGCGREIRGVECTCGATQSRLIVENVMATGMICPSCNAVLIPATGRRINNDCEPTTLMPIDFAKKTTANAICSCCGIELWQPHTRNLGEELREAKWLKISHYANKARKGKKAVWVHRDYITEYLRENAIAEDDYSILHGEGVRRYDPATFIKKHMKNFFDIAIFDEVHTLKGDTAQGHAMHALVKASRRQIALTGTIAGGYAHHLFYMLFRLDPERMRKEGFTWQSVSKFSEKYGSVETLYEANKRCDDEEEYSVSSRGKKLGEPKVKPGISPLVFTKFLLDKAVMLDITDMSSHLPALHENVELVDMENADEHEVMEQYGKVVRFLKDMSKSGHGMTVLSTMLQFSLSYLDKPYGVEPILDPLSGQKLCEPKNFDDFANINHLLPKERRLVEIVKGELAEGRNCFVYAEYTASPQTCITQRLRDVLMHHAGLKKSEVVILESSTVSASEREGWIHDKAAAGMKVCIVNPKCVETGLDFCFRHEGVTYNYPSIIFYQMGYSMFTLYQASRRHYRLNQREECRTYYMAYRGTLQEVVISLIAEKMAATSAIQGKFSAEGLTAMAQGVDTRVRLAQALSNMDHETGKELQSMFDVINDTSSDGADDGKYTPMLLLHELIGEDAALERTVEELRTTENEDIFDILEAVSAPSEHVATVAKESENAEEFSVFSIFELLVAGGEEPVVEKKTSTARKKKEEFVEGQLLLF